MGAGGQKGGLTNIYIAAGLTMKGWHFSYLQFIFECSLESLPIIPRPIVKTIGLCIIMYIVDFPCHQGKIGKYVHDMCNKRMTFLNATIALAAK